MKPLVRLEALLLVAACWALGCASSQVIPLGTDQASRDFLLGEWEGTYEWPTDPMKKPRRVTLSIRNIDSNGAVRAVLQLFDESNSPATRAPENLTGAIENSRILFRNAGNFNLSRIGADRLDGDAQVSTKGGIGASRMDTIEFQFRRVAGSRSALSAPPPTKAAPAPSTFEGQLDALADLRVRGRITEEEYQNMRRRLVEGPRPEALAPPAGPSLPTPPSPQPTPVRWFLGHWQGRQWREGTGEVLTTLLELKQVGHDLTWEMTFAARRVQYLATGTATLVGDRLELRGWYIGGNTTNGALSLTLIPSGETLEGPGRGTDNVPFFASYQRRTP
jgi:hypothetical protein